MRRSSLPMRARFCEATCEASSSSTHERHARATVDDRMYRAARERICLSDRTTSSHPSKMGCSIRLRMLMTARCERSSTALAAFAVDCATNSRQPATACTSCWSSTEILGSMGNTWEPKRKGACEGEGVGVGVGIRSVRRTSLTRSSCTDPELRGSYRLSSLSQRDPSFPSSPRSSVEVPRSQSVLETWPLALKSKRDTRVTHRLTSEAVVRTSMLSEEASG